jgi:hypothetical protein
MTLREKILFHQVHPAKLATDVGFAVISLYFFWQHQLVIALLTHFVPPPLASALVIRLARLIGDVITIIAAWFHSPIGIAAGLMVVLAAWSYGLLPLRRP